MATQPDEQLPLYTTTPVDQIPDVSLTLVYISLRPSYLFADSSRSRECVQDRQNQVYPVPQATASFARVSRQG